MNPRFLLVPIAAVILLTTTGSGALAKSGKLPQLGMPAPAINPELTVKMPGENQYFYLGHYGQPYYLNIDATINWTDFRDRSYYNPDWRNEDWTPYPMYWIVERQCRLMGEWVQYDEANLYHRGTNFSKFLERWSGFGP